MKCVFVGYSSTQKGYKCWDPIGKKLFVSMDVTFREFEPYYTKPWDLDPFLEEFSSVTESDSREGENGCVQNDRVAQDGVIVWAIPCPIDVPAAQEVVDQDTIMDMRSDVHGNGEVIVDENEEVIVERSEEVIVRTIPCSTNEMGTKNGETIAKEPIVYQRRCFRSQG